MTSQPILDFLHTLPAFIVTAPPVIGVSAQARVKVLLQLDRQLTNIFIDPQLLQSPLDLRAMVLEAIEDAQQFRDRQVQLIISRHSCTAKLSLWDVEGTLLSIKSQQTTDFQGIGRNHLVSMVRGQRGEINRMVLNSVQVTDQKELERSIIEAASQSCEKVRNLQKTLPFPNLVLL
jgi:DNA-binding protein YbaB